MEWDASKLKIKLDDLERKVRQVSDDELRLILCHDISQLKTMLNFLAREKIYRLTRDESGFQIADSRDYINMAAHVQKIGPDYAKAFFWLSGIHNVGNKFAFMKKIEENEAFKLIYDFFSFFDKNLLRLLVKYKEEERILLKKSSFSNSSFNGKCFPMGMEGSSYVFSHYDGKLTNCITIVHEFAHAEQFENVTNLNEMQRLLYTVLGEAYAIFMEYVFIEYLKHTKYRKVAFSEQATRLNTFLAYMEYYLHYFYNIEKANFLENNFLDVKGFYQHHDVINLVLSSMLAIYWNSKYIKDPQRAIDEVELFKENIRTKPFREVIDCYAPEILYDGVLDTLKDYCRTYSKK